MAQKRKDRKEELMRRAKVAKSEPLFRSHRIVRSLDNDGADDGHSSAANLHVDVVVVNHDVPAAKLARSTTQNWIIL